MTAPERLKAYLDRTGQNQVQFANESGFSEPFVCQLLNGTRRPSLDKAARLEALTGIPASAWASTEDAEPVSVSGGRRGKR